MQSQEAIERMLDAWIDRAEKSKAYYNRIEDLYAQGRALEIDVERNIGVYLQSRAVADMLNWVLEKDREIP